MIDTNTYKHFGLAFIGALVIALIANENYASWIMAAAIGAWELCQVDYLIRNNKPVRWKPIAWDVFVGVIGTLIGCVIAVWIKA